MAIGLGQERKQGAATMKPIMDWLAAWGLDRQRELNLRLCGHGIGRATTEEVRALIDQGADPNWVAVRALVPRIEANLIMDKLSAIGAKAVLASDIRSCRL